VSDHERKFDDTSLERAIQALPRSQEPSRDLWPSLQAQLPRRQPRRSRFIWAAVAALAALYLSIWIRPEVSQVPIAQSSAPQVDTMTIESGLLNVYELEKAKQLANLSFTNPSINRQLAIWDGAVQQVRVALNYYPDEPRLLRQLDRLYRQQLNYLEELAMLDPQIAAFY